MRRLDAPVYPVSIREPGFSSLLGLIGGVQFVLGGRLDSFVEQFQPRNDGRLAGFFSQSILFSRPLTHKSLKLLTQFRVQHATSGGSYVSEGFIVVGS